MGDIIYFSKKQKGITDQIVDVIDTENLTKDEDFFVVSFVAFDKYFTPNSLGRVIGKSSNELFNGLTSNFLEHALKSVEDQSCAGLFETKFPKNQRVRFFKMESEINIDLATEVGLGVVYYLGEYWLYTPFIDNQPITVIYEMMMQKVYQQLNNPDHIDLNLADSFTKNEVLIAEHMATNAKENMDKLRKIFKIV